MPTTLCILAFAVIGSAFAPVIYLDRLLWMLIQLFLIGGVAANYFDEIKGRPWHTNIAETRLWIVGSSTLLISTLIGVYLALTTSGVFAFFTVGWVVFTLTYDLELFNGRFHNTISLALSWGSVCLGSYYLQNLTITAQSLIVSSLISCISGQGRNLYELAKPVCKDRNPLSSEASRFAWTLLKILIVFVNLYSITILMSRFQY